MERFQQYIDYINNTKMKPIQAAIFDEDWEPIGPMVRRDMMALGIIYECKVGECFDKLAGIYLRPDLVRGET